MAAQAPTKSGASAFRLDLLIGITVSFEPIFCGRKEFKIFRIGSVARRRRRAGNSVNWVNPTGAGRRSFGRRRQTRLDNAQTRGSTLTQRHERLIETSA
jgi:hypothetical protein